MSEQQIIQRFDTSLAGITNNLKNGMTSIQESRGAQDALPHIQSSDVVIRQGDALFKQLDQEKRHMDNASKSAIDRKKKMAQREWDALKASYNQLKSRYSTAQLTVSQQAELRDQRQKLLVAKEISDETTASLNTTENTIQATILVGRDTNQKLTQQTEQMGRMQTSVESTNTSLDNSKTLLMRMKRRILTNKLAQVLIVVFELVILACVIYLRFYSK